MLYGKSRKVLSAIRYLCKDGGTTSTMDISIYLKNRIQDEDLRGCINNLANPGNAYIEIIEESNAYIRVKTTHKGRHFPEYELARYREFLLKSIFTPIIVAFITTLITLWLNGIFNH